MNKESFIEVNKLYYEVIKGSNENEMISPEDENLYLLAFMGLFRSGCTYRIKEDKILIEEEEPVVKQKNKKNQKQAPPKEPEYKTINRIEIKMHNKTFSCDEEKLIEKFGTEYIKLREEREAQGKVKKVAKDKKNDVFNLPYVQFDEKKEEEKPVEEVKEVKDERRRIPFIENDTRYPDDEKNEKQYDSFLFNQHDILVTFSNGKPMKYEAIVYPIEMDTSDTIAASIFVIVKDQDGRTRCEMSEMSQISKKSVNTEFDICTLVFRGEWQDGDFITSAQVLSTENDDHAALEETVTKIRPSARTSSFYLRYQGNDGTWLNAFPTSLLKNNPSTGVAGGMVMVEDGYTRKIYTLDNARVLNIDFDKMKREVAVYWFGNALRIEMSE